MRGKRLRFSLSLTLALLFAIRFSYAQEPNKSSPQAVVDFKETLRSFAGGAPDSCSPVEPHNEDGSTREFFVFEKALALIADALNGASPGGTPHKRADDLLDSLERDSAAMNAAWPEEDRFHATVLDLSPLLVVKLTFREHASVAVFGVPPKRGDGQGGVWQQVGWDAISEEHPSSYSSADVYPLHRGPSGRPRFLVSYVYSGCAGSSGTVYDAREWRGKEGVLDQILKQDGATGVEDARGAFAPIGTLRTTGPTLTLPYCWFSAIDTWDNPSLCAVDTYDLSGDAVRFRSRAYNRPDLAAIQRAVEYAEKHDYPAVRGYCTSSAVARRLVQQPPSLIGDGAPPHVYKTGRGKERIVLGASPTAQFDLVRHSYGWILASFHLAGRSSP